MAKLILLLAGFMMIPVIAFGSFFAWTMRTGGELAQIPVRAALIDADNLDRGNPAGGPVLWHEPDSNLVLLGIPGIGAPTEEIGNPPAPTRAWIVLNEHPADGKAKQRGGFRAYNLSCAYVEHLRHQVPDIDADAVARLEQICRSGRHT
ncbi:MAG TPA: hypothetical protein VLK25_05650 [Allosphingosinicella sp.]|nr:hypothetical protein [Allosphingosinicella sp.]